MTKHALKQIARVVLFLLAAIWTSMIGYVVLLSWAACAADLSYGWWLFIASNALLLGSAYIMIRIWEWKV